MGAGYNIVGGGGGMDESTHRFFIVGGVARRGVRR